MIITSVHGRIKNKSLVEEYVDAIVADLFPRRFKRTVYIDIVIKTKLDENAYGWCIGDRNEVSLEIARKQCWDGKIYQVPYEDMMQTMAHELVHARQFITGKLLDGGHMWRSGNYTYELNDRDHYSEFPWEIEAVSHEERLYTEYKHLLGL